MPWTKINSGSGVIPYSDQVFGCGENASDLLVGIPDPDFAPLQQLAISSAISEASIGNSHGLYLEAEINRVISVGFNVNGVCVQGHTTSPATSGYVRLYDGGGPAGDIFEDAASILGTNGESYVIDSSGDLWGGGQNLDYALGLGHTNARNGLVLLFSGNNVVSFDGGDNSITVLTSDGDVYAAGYNSLYRAGYTVSTDDIQTWTKVSELSNVSAIGRSSFSFMAISNDGLSISGVGWNGNATLGIGHDTADTVNVYGGVSGLPGDVRFTKIVGTDSSYLVLSEDGDLYSWGFNSNGELGLGATGVTNSGVATKISSLYDIVDIAAGLNSFYAIADDGVLYAWGNDARNQLGLAGSSVDQYSPVVMDGGFGYGTISSNHSTSESFVAVKSSVVAIDSPSLFIEGAPPSASGGVDLYIEGVVALTSEIDLIVNGHEKATSGTDLFLHGLGVLGSDSDLFIQGLSSASGITDLFVAGSRSEISGIQLFAHGSDMQSSGIDLFIRGHETSIGLVGTSLFINGAEQLASGADLSIHGFQSTTSDTSLFIEGAIQESSGTSLFVCGIALAASGITLFLAGPITESSSIDIFMHGAPVPLETTCPERSPEVAIQITDRLVGIYQGRIDALINQLGKNVVLYFTPTRTACINCHIDPVRNRSNGVYRVGGPRQFQRGRRCPWCKGDGFLNTEVTKCIQCLIKWNPKDSFSYGISIEDSKSIVRLKTFITSADDMIRAQYAEVDINVSSNVRYRIRKLRGPIPIGLQESRYCLSWWELTGS